MAPFGKRKRRRTTATAKTTTKTTKTKPRKTRYKKQQVEKKPPEKADDLPSNSSTMSTEDIPKISDEDFDAVDSPASGCSTPKAERFRIPEMMTCPPAPKKRRVLSNCSLRRSPIAFFAPPDLETFFVFADISA